MRVERYNTTSDEEKKGRFDKTQLLVMIASKFR
jgi:hypothetical protein